MKPGDLYFEKTKEYGETVNINDGPAIFFSCFNNIPKEYGYIIATHWCNEQVCNGGFKQFFYNATGVLAPEAAEGFRAIGMDDASRLVEEAMKYFLEPYPREQEKRQEMLGGDGGYHDHDAFGELDIKYYNLTEDDRYYKAADEYASHLE